VAGGAYHEFGPGEPGRRQHGQSLRHGASVPVRADGRDAARADLYGVVGSTSAMNPGRPRRSLRAPMLGPITHGGQRFFGSAPGFH
jgi:hypothetical protein